jgi:hypothetical protein
MVVNVDLDHASDQYVITGRKRSIFRDHQMFFRFGITMQVVESSDTPELLYYIAGSLRGLRWTDTNARLSEDEMNEVLQAVRSDIQDRRAFRTRRLSPVCDAFDPGPNRPNFCKRCDRHGDVHPLHWVPLPRSYDPEGEYTIEECGFAEVVGEEYSAYTKAQGHQRIGDLVEIRFAIRAARARSAKRMLQAFNRLRASSSRLDPAVREALTILEDLIEEGEREPSVSDREETVPGTGAVAGDAGSGG